MWSRLAFLAAALAVASSSGSKYVRTGECDVKTSTAVNSAITLPLLIQATHENLYDFTSKEHMEGMPDTTFTAKVKVICQSGTLVNDSYVPH